MKRRNLVALLLCLALALGLFAGCSSKTAETAAEPAAAEAPAEAAPETDEAPTQAAEAPAQETEPEAAPEAPAEAPAAEAAQEPIVTTFDYGFAEPTTYTLWMAESNTARGCYDDITTDVTIFRELGSRLNLFFEPVTVNSDNFTEEFNLMIAAGDYCDIISQMDQYSPGIEDAIENEIIRDFYDLVPENAPHYWAKLTEDMDAYLSQVTNSGYLGTLAIFYTDEESAKSEQQGYLTNGDWYDEFGMDVAQTLDEFHDYLVQANQTYGAVYAMSEEGIEGGLLTAWNIVYGTFVKDGEIHYGYLEDGMFEYLKLMNQWYKEGILEQDFYSGLVDDGGRLAGMANGTYSAWSATAELSAIVNKFDAEGQHTNVVGTPYMKMNADDEIHVLTATSSISSRGSAAWAFRAGLPDEDVIGLLHAVDYMFTDEGILLFNYGVEGEGFAYDENGEPQWTDLVISNPDGLMYNAAVYIYASHNSTTYVPSCMDLTKSLYEFQDNNWKVLETFTTMGDSAYVIPSSATKTVEESEQVAAVSTDIETYVSERIVNFIIGDEPTEADWEAFKAGLYDYGLQQLLDAEESAYARYCQRLEEAESSIG